MIYGRPYEGFPKKSPHIPVPITSHWNFFGVRGGEFCDVVARVVMFHRKI
jgi:hypothetical protein